MSAISTSLSDSFCRVATGGGFSMRTLHSNDEETLFDAERPVILTGIDEIARRGDLVDRCVFLTCRRSATRRAGWRAGLRGRLSEPPGRLAEGGLGGPLDAAAGQFAGLAAHGRFCPVGRSRRSRPGLATGRLPVGIQRQSLHGLRSRAGRLSGCQAAQQTGGPLRRELQRNGVRADRALGRIVPAPITRSAQWPNTPRRLASLLRRIAPQLHLIGIDVRFNRGRNARLITISEVADFERRAPDEA